MNKVHILDDVVVNQIAAGEVVERPSSVVKELVENAIDAAATEISVAISNGGKTSIEVQDNGSGMSREDMLVAVQRFGTSKIRCSEDLERIATLGFRGEALPSIASISRFFLTTSTSQGDEGSFIAIEGGKQSAVEDVPAPKGTKIQVKSLFYNVPARKKFLRTDNTETGQVKAMINDFALAYPKVRFSLSVDTAPSLNYPPVDDFLARVSQLKIAGTSPVEIDEQFVSEGKEIRIRAVLCSPIDSVASSAKLRLLVNGRAVRDKILLKSIRNGYGTFLRPGRHPAGVLSLSMPAEEVDVNVHPQKTEVRFRNPSEVFRAVMLSVSRGLSKSEFTTNDVAEEPRQVNESSFAFASKQGPFGAAYNSSASVNFIAPEAPAVNQVEQVSQELKASSIPDVRPLSEMRYVGQIFSLYLLFEGENQRGACFGMLDMHAAHERVVFFRLKEQYQNKTIEAQQLLLPIEIELDAEEQARLIEGQEILESLGFSMVIENEKLLVQAVPSVLVQAPISRIFRDIVTQQEVAGWERFMETKLDHVLSTIACHGSVRSGRELKEQEVRALLESLLRADASGLCPHGRPVVRYFSEYELEQFFGRA